MEDVIQELLAKGYLIKYFKVNGIDCITVIDSLDFPNGLIVSGEKEEILREIKIFYLED